MSDLVSKEQQEAAEAGKSTSSVAEKILPPETTLDDIVAMAKKELRDTYGSVDESPKDRKPQGRLDIMLVQIMEIKKDANGHAYRPMDDLKDDGDKQYIVNLISRRHGDGDRKMSAREVQRVVDICAKVGIDWKKAHLHDAARMKNGERPHA